MTGGLQMENFSQQARIKKRLFSFENTFQKYADICPFCRALIVWSPSRPKPDICRRCQSSLQIKSSIESKT